MKNAHCLPDKAKLVGLIQSQARREVMRHVVFFLIHCHVVFIFFDFFFLPSLPESMERKVNLVCHRPLNLICK